MKKLISLLPGFILLLNFSWSGVILGQQDSNAATSTYRVYIQPYDLYDSRYCFLTPRPFLCQRCLRRGMRLARQLSFDREGRPYRGYRCYNEPSPPSPQRR